MANYCCHYRTNYFAVEDEQAYAELFSKIDPAPHDFTKTVDGLILHGFGSDWGSGLEMHDEQSGEWLYAIDFARQVVDLLKPGEAFVYMEAGHEKLRYVFGYALVAAGGRIEEVSLEDAVFGMVGEMTALSRPLELFY